MVNDYFVESHPAVLRLVRIVVEEAGKNPVAICGELAAQLDSIPTLLKLGVRSLSVAPPLVPGAKEAIRHASVREGPSDRTAVDCRLMPSDAASGEKPVGGRNWVLPVPYRTFSATLGRFRLVFKWPA